MFIIGSLNSNEDRSKTIILLKIFITYLIKLCWNAQHHIIIFLGKLITILI